MAIKPILFNTEMVRAILDGRKACTRRILKGGIPFDEKVEYWNVLKKGEWSGPICSEYFIKQCSPYKPGDILYVRETWKKAPNGYYYYEDWQKDDIADVTKWKPSIHMPKEAARIWLKVTDVRVERLQEMWASDVPKEGIYFNKPTTADEMLMAFAKLWNSTIKKTDIDRYGWNANPWAWVIEFERCEKPEGEN
jgi:hypothetical protein